MFSTILTKFLECFLYLLKTVEIVIIQASGGILFKMRQQILKALANPPRIFYVPYSLAVINFAVQFIVFIIIFVAGLIISGGGIAINPLYFLLSVILVHMILAFFAKREPQLGQIVAAKIQLLKQKVPGRLAA